MHSPQSQQIAQFCSIFSARKQYVLIMVLLLLAASLPTLHRPTSVKASSTNFTTQFLEATFASSTVIGDLNNDGALDIVIGNYNGQTSIIYLNDGHGNFPIAQTFGTATTTFSVVVGDINNDGWLDIVAGEGGGQSIVYLNDGHGNFVTAQPFGVASNTRSLALGDVNGDGWLDIAAGNADQPSVVYLNDGHGSFPTVQPFGETHTTQSVSLADLNGDGALDIVTGNGLGAPTQEQSYMYLNDGNGHFPNAQPFGELDNTSGMVVGDYNGDGHFDIVTVDSSQTKFFLNNGQGIFTESTVSIGSDRVAISDIDGDGRLDIIESGHPVTQPSAIYLNGENPNFISLGRADLTTSMAIGDLNGDGALDIVAGNSGTQSVVYINNNVRNISPTATSFGGKNATTSVIVGDFSNKGSLDILSINEGAASVIYRNNGIPNQINTPLVPGDAAVGDMNGDGALDIIVGDGNAENPSQGSVYFNDGAGNFTSIIAFGIADANYNLAVGDVNSDGFLDIVASYVNHPSMVYFNDGNGKFSVGYPFSGLDTTGHIALGDLNGDGALDIAVGNNGQPSKVFLNDGYGHFDPGYIFSGKDTTTSIAIGDMNGDSALDIIVGNLSLSSKVYLNDGSGHFGTGYAFSGPDFTSNIALGDINGDGFLDIVAGNYLVSSAVYFNDGTGQFSLPIRLPGVQYTSKVALGDLNGDSTLDIIISNYKSLTSDPNLLAQSVIDFNRFAPASRLSNNGPAIVIHRPGTPDAAFLSAGKTIDSPIISIPYTLSHSENVSVRVISATYSLNGGGSWHTAVPTNTVTTNLATSPTGISYTFNWDTFASGFFGQSDNVVFRIVAYPGVQPTKNGVAGPYQRPYASATTFPFRVRGAQVRVMESGAPVGNAHVYRLPKGQASGFQLIAPSPGAAAYTTDAQGYLRGRGQIGIGDQLIALAPISTTAAFSTTYTLYHTNMAPTITGTLGFTVTNSGVQRIDVSAAHPLALFPLDISLEWDARNDQRFMSQLQSDLARTSEFLFNATNGQAALGEVRIFQDKQWWDAVNLRIYASNRVRPNSVVGGVTTQPITDAVSLRADDPVLPPVEYGPGQLRMGAVWNRFGNAGTNLSEDWPRTLAHELGHYLFFLEDNYIGTDSHNQIVPVSSCPGLMSDPYASNGELHPEVGWLPGCAQTLSNRSTERSDWSTVQAFYPALIAPTVPVTHPLIAGPTNLPLAVTRINSYSPITPTATLDVPIFYLTYHGARYQPGLSARGYLFSNRQANPQLPPDRITPLGRGTLDQILARGARPNDRVCLYEPERHIEGCTTVTIGNEQIALANTAGWAPDLTVTPVTSTTLALAVSGVLSDVQALGLNVQLFPADADTSATAPAALRNAGNGIFTGTITLASPVAEAQIHVWVNEADNGARRELVTSLSLGGNPGYLRTGGGYLRTGGGYLRTGGGYLRTGGGYLRTGGGYLRTGGAPVSSAEGDVLLLADNLTFQVGQFLALQTTTTLPKLPSWATLIGNAYRFTASSEIQGIKQTSLSFSYLGSDVPVGEEQGVYVYFWDGANWNRLPTTRDTYYHIASVRNQGPGLYALMSSVQIALQGPGWNIFADPVAGTRPITETLASIDGAYTTVYGYTANDKNRPWKVYDVDAPDWVDSLHDLTFGQGYWIHATDAITLYLKGNTGAITTTAAVLATQAESLPTPPATYYGALPVVTSKTGLTVQATVNGIVCGQAQTQPHPIRGHIYEAYAITVSAADAGDHVGCGVPGQPMTVAFFDGTQEIAQIQTGWDNSHVIELRPSIVRLPIMRSLSDSRPSTDLAVVGIEVQPIAPQVGQSTEVKVTIQNTGTTDITAPFWVDLYIDPRATPQVNQTWPQLADYGVSWRVYGLKAGATLTLTSHTPNDPLNPDKNYSNFSTFVHNGVHQVYVLVDSYAPGEPTGTVGEDNEHNNLIGPLSVTVGGSQTTAQTTTVRVDRRP